MKDTLAARFWAKVPGVPHIDNVTPEKWRGRCWPWAGAHIPEGYGSIYVNEQHRQVGAHRVAYELMRGPIPGGLQLDHLCRNRGCVNPWHLEAVTLRENLRRGAHSKRDLTHCQHGHPFSGANLLIDSLGRRVCLTCRRSRRRRRYHERARAAGIPARQFKTPRS